jgi:hypothetical protein
MFTRISQIYFPGCGTVATYYSSASLTSPVATRLAASIDFSGSSLSSQPVNSLASGVGWSVRWAGFVRAPVAGGATWTFFVGLTVGGNGADGVRGWVDGVAVVDAWGGVAGSEVSGTVVLSGASNSYYEVVVEYKAGGGAYGCTLSWQSSSWPKQVLPSEFSFVASHVRNSPLFQFLPRAVACKCPDISKLIFFSFIICSVIVTNVLQLYAPPRQLYHFLQQHSLIKDRTHRLPCSSEIFLAIHFLVQRALNVL